MSSQPSDPRPQDPPPRRPDGTTDPPPPGFLRSVADLFANRNAKVLLAIVLVLLVLLGIAMVASISSTSEGPGTAAVRLAVGALPLGGAS